MSLYARLLNWIVPDAALRLRRPLSITDVDRILRDVFVPRLSARLHVEAPILRLVRERSA